MSMWRVGRESVGVGTAVVTPLDRSVAETRAAESGAAETRTGETRAAEIGAAEQARAAGEAGAGAGRAGAGRGEAGRATGVGIGGPLGDIADVVAKWIPGEVLALYVAGVTMIGRPSWFWLVVGVLLAPVTVLLAAFANSGRFPPDGRTGVRAGLGFLAMVLWSLTVPASGWRSWTVVRDNPAAVALAAGVIGLLFGLVAEGLARWVDGRPASRARHTGPAASPSGRATERPAADAAGRERAGWAPAGRPDAGPRTAVDAPPPARRGVEPQPLRMPSIPPLE